MIRGKWVVSPDYKDSYIEVLTENLLPLRTKAEITQEELSAMVGISRQHCSDSQEISKICFYLLSSWKRSLFEATRQSFG